MIAIQNNSTFEHALRTSYGKNVAYLWGIFKAELRRQFPSQVSG